MSVAIDLGVQKVPYSIPFAIGGGAAAGAVLRWRLGVLLNSVFPTVPIGTLAANLLGGLLMGVAMELLARHEFSPEIRLMATTGFLGGLTTFSTFSAEVVTLLLRREWLWASIAISIHLVGSLTMTVTGILLIRAVYALAAA